jgi:hypothetical protein
MISCGNCKGQHATVQQVRECCNAPAGGVLVQERPAGGAAPASDRQKDLIAKLLGEREVPEPYLSACIAYCTNPAATVAGARTMIERLLAMPRGQVVRHGTVTEDGMYRNPQTGEIFKVQWNRASGDGRRLYAKQLVLSIDGGEWSRIPLEPVAPAPVKVDARFEYAAGALQRLRPEWKMTRDEAKAFGALYGTCCVCGRTLTDEQSIADGIGPVCGSKF